MKITIDIPTDLITDLIITFVESGDPVTQSWCASFKYDWSVAKLSSKPWNQGPWYAEDAVWDSPFSVIVEVIEDESDPNNTTAYILNNAKLEQGLQIMAEKYPHMFKDIVQDNTDAATADLLMQCALFGEEVYG